VASDWWLVVSRSLFVVRIERPTGHGLDRLQKNVLLRMYRGCKQTPEEENVMETFVQKHQDKITGVLSCPDRVLFKGHLSLNRPETMQAFLLRQGLLFKDFKDFCKYQSKELKRHAQCMAKRAGRPYEYKNHFIRKEDYVRQMAERDQVREGLICVLATQESCTSFKLLYGDKRPHLAFSKPKCLCLYFYFMDPKLGLMHVRLQTWFPFTIQVYVNGHSWLARKLDRHDISCRAIDNAFVSIENPARAQRFADGFVKQNWPRILCAFAKRVNPLLKGLLEGYSYYWVTDQFEYATDVMFEDSACLEALYKQLLEHATLCFSAEDVLVFLGRKLNGNFNGEVLNDRKKRRQGARVKHRMKQNWIKMYDKFGCVLRIETVINHPYEFRVRRQGIRQGQTVMGWFPMAKGVANLPRYKEVCLAANRRYIEALAVVDDPTEAFEELPTLAKRLRKAGRSYRGFNPLSPPDITLFATLLRGEHHIMGFRNKDIRCRLFPGDGPPQLVRRNSARVSRLFRILHVHGLIAKIPRSRRWRLTQRGLKLMTAAISLFNKHYPQQYAQSTA